MYNITVLLTFQEFIAKGKPYGQYSFDYSFTIVSSVVPTKRQIITQIKFWDKFGSPKSPTQFLSINDLQHVTNIRISKV